MRKMNEIITYIIVSHFIYIYIKNYINTRVCAYSRVRARTYARDWAFRDVGDIRRSLLTIRPYMNMLNNVKHKRERDAFLGLRLPTATLDGIRAAATSDERSTSAYVVRVLEAHLRTIAERQRAS